MATIEQAIGYLNNTIITNYKGWLRYCKENNIKDTKIKGEFA